MRQQMTGRVISPPPQDYSMPRPPKETLFVSEAGARWLQGKRLAVKDSTYIKYEVIWRRHIAPALGGLCAGEVNIQVIEAFSQSLLAQGLASKTRRDILTVLRSILGYMAAQGWTASDQLYCRRT